MTRSCILPEEEYQCVEEIQITHSCQQFYDKYEKVMGLTNCSYSVHIICSHLLQMRSKGPLTSHSAFPFEGFYSELKNKFTPGTTSTLKQMLQNILIKRSLAHHCCEPSIYLANHNTVMENNSQIYCLKGKFFTSTT